MLKRANGAADSGGGALHHVISTTLCDTCQGGLDEMSQILQFNKSITRENGQVAGLADIFK